ncbi:MAG: hypothetical protein AAF547_12820 [Actinomycetota bacterium]
MVEFSLLTSVTIIAALAIVPIYFAATYRSAGVGWRTTLMLTTGIVLYGLVATLFVVEWQFAFDGPYVVPVVMVASLAVPPLVVLAWPDRLVPEGIGLPWLVGVQAFRVIGGLYLFEHARGNVGPEFAYWAGIGDVITGIAASALLVAYRLRGRMPRWAVYATILFGCADFAWAYAIGVLSFETPIQTFSLDAVHATNRFPIAMIPFFLAPIAMGFMIMTLLALGRERAPATDAGGATQVMASTAGR